MSDRRESDPSIQHDSLWRSGFRQVADVAPIVISVWLLNSVLQHYELYQTLRENHGFMTGIATALAALIPYYYLSRRRRQTERAAFAAALRQGQITRTSLASRSVVLLVTLCLVVAGLQLKSPSGPILLLLGVPTLLLFAIEELNIVLRPGKTVSLRPSDELTVYFRGKSLLIGYAVTVVLLMVVFVVSLFATRYVVILLPAALIISLLIPSFIYSRLDIHADANE
jgi:hypothetical protein